MTVTGAPMLLVLAGDSRGEGVVVQPVSSEGGDHRHIDAQIPVTVPLLDQKVRRTDVALVVFEEIDIGVVDGVGDPGKGEDATQAVLLGAAIKYRMKKGL